MHPFRRTLLALILAAFVSGVVGGCERTTSQPSPGATANPADLDFVNNAWDVIHFDQEICAEAQGRATDPQVKQLAGKILEKANAFDRQLTPIAQAKNIQPPQVLRSDLRIRLVHARLQSGSDFDKIFLADEIATHQEALVRSQMMMRQTAEDPQIRGFLHEGRQLLRDSLGQLVALQARIGSPVFVAEDAPPEGGGGR